MASQPLLKSSSKASYGSESVEMANKKSVTPLSMSKSAEFPPGTSMFRDQRRRVDFVLVYKDDADEGSVEMREYFHTELRKAGLHLEEIAPEMDESTSSEAGLYWILIHAPTAVLMRHAEEMGWKMPVRIADDDNEARLCDPGIFKTPLDTHRRIPDYYAALFRRDLLKNFLNYDKPNKLFSNAQRGRLVYDILQEALFSENSSDLGIDKLLETNVYLAAFPPHEGHYSPEEQEPDADDQPETARQELRRYWARWGVWYKNQPLDHIKEYFGEAVAFYFAWLGMYTVWLIPAALFGLFVVVYGAATLSSSPVVNQTCSSTLDMCPTCKRCDVALVNASCIYAKLSRLFDNEFTLAFAVIMSFWATFFLEFWKRKTIQLAYRWDVLGEEEEAERPRPQYCIKATGEAPNPITGRTEPYFPPSSRTPRFLTGWSIIAVMFVLLLILVIGVIFYRTIILVVFLGSSFRAEAPVLTSLTGSILNLVVIIIMSFIYSKLATFLTNWEMHRTDDDYNYHLTMKMYLFEFVNYYSSLFYIAFFKGRFSGYPCDYTTVFGFRLEQCTVSGCFYELSQQLLIILVGKQIFNNFMEIVVPKIKVLYAKWKMKRMYGSIVENEQWKRDFYECEDFGGLFGEYLEMVIQFGFVTVFVAAMPLAPLFSLLNNIVEIRLDARKFITQYRRPVAMKADGIGIWQTIISTVATFAVVANAFLIAFTSEIIPEVFYRYVGPTGNMDGYVHHLLSKYNNETNGTGHCISYGLRQANTNTCYYKKYSNQEYYYHLLLVRTVFVILFEHFVFGIVRLIDLFVPDIPRSLYLKIKREEYLAKSALSEDVNSPPPDQGEKSFA
ncbi:anoctamin-7-like [Oscarella lobularis]|uniref:anoctamin-7-like n=1 Tax=Oscarella lobularis TaxID=121494 RepID=UPI003313310C